MFFVHLSPAKSSKQTARKHQANTTIFSCNKQQGVDLFPHHPGLQLTLVAHFGTLLLCSKEHGKGPELTKIQPHDSGYQQAEKGEKSMVNLMNLMNSNLKKHPIPIHEITSNLMFDDIILSTSLSSTFSMLAVTCIKNLRKFLGFFGSPSLVVFELPNSLKLWAGLRKCSPLKAAGESWPTRPSG